MHVAGVDEVGRGCLAGPVVAGAVILQCDEYVPGIADSKVLTALERERLFGEITGISVAWHRSPFTLGCAGDWTDDARKQHYDALCQIDGRIVLAGEHASYIPAWQEGAILSSLDAIGRLHKRVLQG